MDTKPKPAKKKVLLMGKSGSGKSSMRSIIFSNYVAKDVRRLGATIDVEHSQIKFLGNLILNLWDCGGQDAFTETYLTTQKPHIFTSVGVLIYVFDVESRSFEGSSPRDLATFASICNALHQYSPDAHIFCLIHKMDLILEEYRAPIFAQKVEAIRRTAAGEGFSNAKDDRIVTKKRDKGENQPKEVEERVRCYATSIWDQTLYAAWGDIVHSLIPNLDVTKQYLRTLAQVTAAEEIILFERATFLTVTSHTSPIGERNPYDDRFEKLSNLIKTFKHSLLNYTSSTSSSHPFSEFNIKAPRFNLVLARLTGNTYVLVVLPPGEADINCTRANIAMARDEFSALDGLGGSGKMG